MPGSLLRVKNLKTHFFSDEGIIRAVEGVSFGVGEGETLGVVGESGCGKSVTALSILRLIDSRQGAIVAGEVWWRGRDLRTLKEREMREIRGGEIAIIFQDPYVSLNPVFTIGRQMIESVRIHRGVGRREAEAIASEALARVHIPSPRLRMEEYPHHLSGGMQQRVMIAMALCCTPSLLIADEPTTALDVTIQAQILDLLREVQQRTGMALILISHDLGLVSEIADRIEVMYAGRIVEEGIAGEILTSPRHPYTSALLRSMPRLGGRGERLKAIRGSVPNPLCYPEGCCFHPRCEMAEEICGDKEPVLRDVEGGRRSACHFAERLAA